MGGVRMQPDNQPDYEKPVAYTPEGQPLYAHPVAGAQPVVEQQATVVHLTRSMDPVKQEIPQEIRDRHDDSVRRYPQLDLSEHEYVIMSVRRHVVGLLPAAVIDLSLILAIVLAILFYPSLLSALSLESAPGYPAFIMFAILTCAVLVGVFYIIRWIYYSNLFFLTNESIIEKTQLTPFSSNVKSSGLAGIVDVSYKQTGIVQQMLDFGTVQVGTQDDEAPYVFNYVVSPKQQASILKDAVEAFKNGRAINEDSIDAN
jgi:hypothetical protein